MKCDILLCSLNSKYIHASLAPWCLYTSIMHEVPAARAIVYENTINAQSSLIIDELLKCNSRVYAFSCYIWNISNVLEIAKAIKCRVEDAIILLGGPEVSYCAKKVLEENSFVDYIISGEGEVPIAEFAKTLIFGGEFKNIKGIAFKGHCAEPYIALAEPKSPYCREFFDNLNGRIAYIETTRGCPYSCAFCLSGRCGGVREFALDRIFDEIIALANSGSKTIKFVDRTFNSNSKRANLILEFILENSGKTFPGDVCFHFEIAGDILKESTLEILKSAPIGLFQLEIGLQTFNEHTLEYISRKTNTSVLVSNIKKLISMENMHIHIDLIAGLPYEDITSFEKTFNRVYNLKADMLQLGFLKLLHGSPMREEREKFPCTFSPVAPYEVLETPWISGEELSLLHKCEDALDRLSNSGRFLAVLDYLIYEKWAEPFKLFCDFGKFTADMKNASLDEYSQVFFDYILENFDIPRELLRDKFVIDRMASNASGKLPQFLKEDRKEYKKIKRYLKSKNINEGFALLSTENIAVFQDKAGVRSKNGRYNLIFEDIDKLL